MISIMFLDFPVFFQYGKMFRLQGNTLLKFDRNLNGYEAHLVITNTHLYGKNGSYYDTKQDTFTEWRTEYEANNQDYSRYL